MILKTSCRLQMIVRVQKVCSGGPTLTTVFFLSFVFLVDEGREDPNTITGPLTKWCFAGGLMMAQHAGLVAFDFSGNADQYCKEPLYYVIFQGGMDTQPPSLDPRM